MSPPPPPEAISPKGRRGKSVKPCLRRRRDHERHKTIRFGHNFIKHYSDNLSEKHLLGNAKDEKNFLKRYPVTSILTSTYQVEGGEGGGKRQKKRREEQSSIHIPRAQAIVRERERK